jgi:thiamine biosynthesis lipoprotein
MVERARPLLGTKVSVRIDGLEEAAAHAAIDRAFSEIEQVQRAMSFHHPSSALSRLNRQAHLAPVPVDRLTFGVVRRALFIAAASEGRFEPVVGRALVDRGVLPRPEASADSEGRADEDALHPFPSAADDASSGSLRRAVGRAATRNASADAPATFRDVRLLDGKRIAFLRPLWLDLGGIAKGYAVDRALARLRLAGAKAGCVNAGGDLRVFGPAPEPVLLRSAARGGEVPVLMLEGGALATSAAEDASDDTDRSGLVLDGQTRAPVTSGWTAAVVARSAWLADALTKVLLCDPFDPSLLERFGAMGWVHSARTGWLSVTPVADASGHPEAVRDKGPAPALEAPHA